MLTRITISLILSFMEFPWSAIGAIMATVTTIALISSKVLQNIRKNSLPKLDAFLYVHPKGDGAQKGVIQTDKEQLYEKQIQVLPNICPRIGLLIKWKSQYVIEQIEVRGNAQSKKSLMMTSLQNNVFG